MVTRRHIKIRIFALLAPLALLALLTFAILWSPKGAEAQTPPNAAPRFTSSATFDAAENQTAVGTVVAVDDDSQDSVTYSLQGGADEAKFSLSAAGVLTFKTAPNYEFPTDVASTAPANEAMNNEYIVIVRATSGAGARQLTADQTVTVTVTDADDAPTGRPTISGTVQVGKTLTASANGIADEDSGLRLIRPRWNYQWKRVDESTDPDTITNIGTGPTYQLKVADQGKKVRVTVSFTDENSNAHSLDSADSGAIASADLPSLVITGRLYVPGIFNVYTTTLTFNRVVTGFAKSDVTVTNGSKGAFTETTTGRVWTLVVTPSASFEGDVTVAVAQGAATGPNGVGNAAASADLAVDTKPPVLTATNTTATNRAVVTGNRLRLYYNEPVGPVGPNFEFESQPAIVAAYTVESKPSGGSFTPITVTRVHLTGGNFGGTAPRIILVLAYPVSIGDTVRVSYVKPGIPLRDWGGNEAAAFTNHPVPNRTTRPTLAITGPSVKARSAFTVTLTFDQDITDRRNENHFTASDVSVTNGSKGVFTKTTSGTHRFWTLVVTPTASFEGNVTVAVAQDAATGYYTGVGNAAASADFAVDTKPPGLSTATVDGNALVLTYDETLGSNTPATSAYTVETQPAGGSFTGVTVDTVTVNTRTVTLALTSAVGVGDNVRVSYVKPTTNKLTDAVGNEAAALSNQAVTNSSAARPTLTITGPTTETKDPFTVTLTFNKVVTGFAASDVTVTRGSKGAFTETTAGKVWTLVVTPDAGEDDNDVSVSVAQDAASANGVGNAAASADFDVDTKPPALSTAAVDGNVLTLTYDETLGANTPVTSAYTVEQRAGSSGPWSAVTVDSVTVNTTAKTVTLALTSAVGVGDNVRVSYVKPGSNQLTDAIGNEAAALANQAVTNSSARPTLTITGPTTETRDPFTVTLTFNKAVTGFTASDVTVTRGSKGAFTETTAAKVWTLVITPAAGEDDNDVTVSVAQDAATNNGVGNAAASADFDVDTRPPALSTAAVDGNVLTLTYDETLGANTPVTSAYTVEQRAGSSGPWSAVTVSTVTVSGSKVTLALASAVGVGDNVRVSYAKPTTNKLTDAIGNEAAALANQTVSNSSARPTLTITGPTTETKDPFTVTLTFNKAVTGFTASDVSVTRGSKGAFTETTAGTVWTLVVTPAAGEDDNDVEVSVAQDAATNNGVGNAAASADFDVDTRPPALSTAAVDGNALVLTYDETLGANTPVTSAYTVEQRAGSSGPWSAVTVSTVTVSGSKVTLALTSAVGVGDNVRVSYAKPASNKLTDAIGNEAAALANRAVTNSSARPTLTITGPTTETKDPFTVTLTFNKAVTGFTASDVSVTRGSKGAFTETTAAKVWTLVVTPAAGEDDNDVEVSVAQDAATNNGVGNAAASADFDVDTRPPALSTAAVNGNSLTLTYDETLGANTPVTSAYTVEQRAGSSGPWSAVTVDSVTVNATAKTVTLALTGTVGVGDNVRVSYAKPTTNKLSDAIGNEAAALANQTVTNSSARPTLTITGPTTETKDPFTVTLTFNKAVTGFVAADVSVTRGSKGAFSETTAAKVWTLVITPAAGEDDNDVEVSVAQDAATNNGVGNAAASADFDVDTRPPALSTAAVDGNVLTLTYDETLGANTPVTSAYTVEQRAGSSGPWSAVTVSTVTVSGSKVTLALTSAVGVGDNVRVSYVKPTTNKLTDAIGNEAAALNNQTVTNSSARPTLTITGPTTETKDPFTVTFTFNKAVTGFAASDVSVTRGSKGAFTETTAAKVWTLVVTPAAGEDDNDVEVSVAQDAATNNGVGNAAASADFDVDTRPPALSTAAVDGNVLTLTYDETLGANTPVTSAYTVEQRAGSSGPWSAVTVDTVTVSTSAKTVTLALTSAVGVGDNVRVSYAKPSTNKLTDAIGNEADALSNQTVTNNSARPTLTISGPTTETKDPFTVTLTFNKAVTGFTASDVSVTRGSKGAFSETTAGTVWTLVVTPAAGEDDNDVEVSVAQDAATNNGVGNAAASADFDVDTRPPALSTAAVDGNSLTLTYDETLGANTPVTSAYTVEQRAGSSGPWSAVTVDTVTVSGSKVTLALTSAVGVGDSVRVSYVKPTTNKLTDAIGNEAAALANRAVTNSSARPTLTITGPTTETKDPFTVTLTFNKAVTGFVAADVSVTRGSKGAFSETTAAKVWTLVITPAAGEDDNDVEVSVAQDAATNNGVGNAAASADFDVDTRPPALSTAAVNGNVLTLTYDETLGANTPVTSAYTVEQRAGSSGPWSAVTVSTVTVSGSKVTLALTSAVGVGNNVRVSYVKPATNKLTDAIGNEAAALANRAVTNGSARPTLTITGPTTETKDPFTVTLTFNKVVTGFTASDVAVTRGSKGAFTETTAGTIWTLVVTPAAGEDDNDVEVSVAQDAATYNGVGNAAASADFDVDTKPPVLSTATVNGNSLVLTYDETLGANTPVTSAYTVEQRAGSSGPWSAVTVDTVTVSGSKVTLALTSAVGVGDNVRVSYAKPTTNKLTDAIGNEAAALSNEAVTNSSARPTLTITGPTTETKDPFTVTFTFNKAVTGFVAADVTVTRGSKGAFTETTAAKVWTLVVTPDANEDDNDVSVSVAQDAATNNGVGNAAASADFDVDTRPPALSTAAVDGNSLTLTYDETLGSNTPATSAYTVEQRAGSSGPWSAVTVDSVTVNASAKTVTLALTSAVGVGDNVRVSYVKPASNKLSDAIGNEAAALSNQAVSNSSARPTLTITGPTTETKDPFTVTLTFQQGGQRLHRQRRECDPRQQGRLHRNHRRHGLDTGRHPRRRRGRRTTSEVSGGAGRSHEQRRRQRRRLRRLRRRHQAASPEHGRSRRQTPSSSPTTRHSAPTRQSRRPTPSSSAPGSSGPLERGHRGHGHRLDQRQNGHSGPDQRRRRRQQRARQLRQAHHQQTDRRHRQRGRRTEQPGGQQQQRTAHRSPITGPTTEDQGPLHRHTSPSTRRSPASPPATCRSPGAARAPSARPPPPRSGHWSSPPTPARTTTTSPSPWHRAPPRTTASATPPPPPTSTSTPSPRP